MNSIIKFLSAAGIFIFSSIILSGQEWNKILESSNNYYEIVEKSEKYFDENGRGKGSGFKQFNRWQEDVIYRIDADGTINYSIKNERKAYQKLNNSSLNRSHHGSWGFIGPNDYTATASFHGGGIGRVSCMAFHPTDEDIMWVGTPAGGLWKTVDGGVNWTALTDGFPRIGVAGISILPSNPNHIVLLTGDNATGRTPSIGVLKSIDGGSTWSTTSLEFDPEAGVRAFQLKQHPTNGNILYAGFDNDTLGGLHKSIDGGASWTQVISGRTVWDVEFKPGTPSQMYAAVSNGSAPTLMISVDSGDLWGFNGDSNFPSPSSRMSIAVSPSNSNTLYAVFGGNINGNGTFPGLYKSTDSGNTFGPAQSTSPNILGGAMDGGDALNQSGRDLAIIVDPTNDNRVFVGGINMWGSDNSGAAWDRKTWWRRDDPLQPFVHADFQGFYFANDKFWIINDGGIYYTTDLAHSFVELTAGMGNTEYYFIDVKDGVWIGGTQDNGTSNGNMTSSGSTIMLGGDGRGCTWPTNGSFQFISSQNNVRRSDFIATPIFTPPINGSWWVGELKMHTTDPNYLFVEQRANLWRGNENCCFTDWNWVDLGTNIFPLSGFIRGFSQGSNNSNKMYVSFDNLLAKTSNVQSNTPSWTPLSHPDDSLTYMDIVVDPANSARVWAICGGYSDGKKVYYSANEGVTWNNFSGTLPNIPMRSIEYVSGSNDAFYLGTQIGVFYRDASMSDWKYFGNHLPNVPINDIKIPGDGYVYVGTMGRGIWRSPEFSNCPPNLILTNANDPTLNQTGTQFFSASNNILSLRSYLGNPGTEVYYQAGSHTDLSLGFEVKAGAFFEAKTGDCPN